MNRHLNIIFIYNYVFQETVNHPKNKMAEWNNIGSLPTLEERVEAEERREEAIGVCMRKLTDKVEITVRRTSPPEVHTQRISNTILINLLVIWKGLFRMIHKVQAEPFSWKTDMVDPRHHWHQTRRFCLFRLVTG